MASILPDSILRDTTTGAVDLDSDTFYAMLLGTGYTPSKSHAKRSDLTSEVSGTGYTAGGQVCTITVTLDTVNHKLSVAVADVTWTSANGFTAQYVAIYKHRGGAASADELVAIGDFGSGRAAGGGNYVVSQSSPITIQN